jgi:hypothetical protein
MLPGVGVSDRPASDHGAVASDQRHVSEIVWRVSASSKRETEIVSPCRPIGKRRADEVLVRGIVQHDAAPDALQVERVAAARVAREEQRLLHGEVAARGPDLGAVARARAVLVAAVQCKPLHRHHREADASEVLIHLVDADQLDARVDLDAIREERARIARIADVVRIVAGVVAVARAALVAHREMAELARQPGVRTDDAVTPGRVVELLVVAAQLAVEPGQQRLHPEQLGGEALPSQVVVREREIHVAAAYGWRVRADAARKGGNDRERERRRDPERSAHRSSGPAVTQQFPPPSFAE